jgi:polyhydroxyalkanoate synthesis regulator phasin
MKNKIIVLTSAVVIGGILMTGSSTLAEGNRVVRPQQEKRPRMENFIPRVRVGQLRGPKLVRGKTERSSFVENLVKDGVITQETADKINAYVMQKQEEMKKKQAEIRTKRPDWLNSRLDKLVADGKITQEQVDKILEKIKEKQQAAKEEMDKIKNMTKEELKAYFESKKGQKADIIAELVDDGIITQEQADDVKKAIGPQGFPGGMSRGVPKKQKPKIENDRVSE